jgi:hypothetical protein
MKGCTGRVKNRQLRECLRTSNRPVTSRNLEGTAASLNRVEAERSLPRCKEILCTVLAQTVGPMRTEPICWGSSQHSEFLLCPDLLQMTADDFGTLIWPSSAV